MEFSKNYIEYNDLGIELYNSGKGQKNKFQIKSAIQYFKKAIAAAEIEGIEYFESAKKNLELAKKELNKIN
jgi:hypothetical protein